MRVTRRPRPRLRGWFCATGRWCCEFAATCSAIRPTAHDAFQATFLVLLKRSGSIRRLESLGSWLYGVAARVSARARADAARRCAAEQRAALRVVQVIDSSDESGQDRAEFGTIVQEEVRRLPEPYRAVVVLCYWQGLTHEQAAAQLGCPLGTVRSRMARARKLLHRRLTRRGMAPVAAVMAAVLEDSSVSASVLKVGSQLSAVPRTRPFNGSGRGSDRIGSVPAQVVARVTASLVERVLWSMTMIRTCKIMAVLALTTLVAVGVSLWAQPPSGEDLDRSCRTSCRKNRKRLNAGNSGQLT